MPKIKWLDLPPHLREHLFDRAKERSIGEEDLFALEEWRRHSPDVPEGHWYKDFGSFKLCGEGEYPKTFLLQGQPAHGQEVEWTPCCPTLKPRSFSSGRVVLRLDDPRHRV
jgi:hypothetical protein